MKKPSPIQGFTHILNFALPCTPKQIEALMLMKGYVFSIDWWKKGVLPVVVAEVLDGKEIIEIANQLNLEKRQVENMLFRVENALRDGFFFDALFHYLSGDAKSALQCMKALGFSENRQLPVELYSYIQPRKGSYALEECEAEFNYVASYSLSHMMNMPTGIDRHKVAHILGILHSDHPDDMPDRFRLTQRLGEASRPYGWDHLVEPKAKEQG